MNSRSSGVVVLVITPLVIAYQAGRGRFSGIARDFRTRRGLALQCGDGLFEMEDFPGCDAEVEQSDAARSEERRVGKEGRRRRSGCAERREEETETDAATK